VPVWAYEFQAVRGLLLDLAARQLPCRGSASEDLAARDIGRIRDLEKSLGVSLFDRSERGVRLTAKCNELLQYATQFMALAADIRQRVDAQGALSGRVRFGATNIHALTWLPSLIERVSRSHRGILVEVAVDTSETMQLLLERGSLDMAVIAGPIESAKLKTETVGRVANAFVASPKLTLPVEPMAARDHARWAIISDRPGTHLHNATKEWFREEDAEPRQLHSCSHLPTRIHFSPPKDSGSRSPRALQCIGSSRKARSSSLPRFVPRRISTISSPIRRTAFRLAIASSPRRRSLCSRRNPILNPIMPRPTTGDADRAIGSSLSVSDQGR
jgi:DNA-binding transcriptional LysR family regulator